MVISWLWATKLCQQTFDSIVRVRWGCELSELEGTKSHTICLIRQSVCQPCQQGSFHIRSLGDTFPELVMSVLESYPSGAGQY